MADAEPEHQRAARLALAQAREAAEAGAHARVPKLITAARGHVNDGELSSLADRYALFFDVDPAPEPPYEAPVCWLGRGAGAELDAIHRALLAAYRRAGGEWEAQAMEQSVLLEHSEEQRLVYADWLQSRGHPRGEFMALQAAYAREGLSEQGRARMEALLSAHARDWGSAFVRRGATILAFRRGFPSIVRQGRASVARLSEIGAHWRTIDRVEGPDAPELRGCRHISEGDPWASDARW